MTRITLVFLLLVGLVVQQIQAEQIFSEEEDEYQGAPDHFFNCQLFNQSLRDDVLAKNQVFTALSNNFNFKLDCLTLAIQNNLFDTNQFLLDNYFFKSDKFSNEEMMEHVQKGINNVNQQYSRMLNKIHEDLKKPVVMSPPFYWAQDLKKLQFEIKYAYRHDVAGCADLFNQTVKIEKDVFYVGASCKELD